MILEKQIFSLIFSFLYGIIISYLYNLNYNFIYKTKFMYKVLINLLFGIDFSLIYFILILKINGGIVHSYFLLIFFISFYLFRNKYINLRKIVKLYVKPLKRVEK